MREQTVWTFTDLGLFLGTILPAFLITSVCTAWIDHTAVRTLASQTLLYFLLMAALTLLARVRHGQSLAEAANWTLNYKGVWWCVALAPVLALTTNVLVAWWQAPLVPSAIDQLAFGAIPLPIVAIFAVVIGPLFEELAFRGFLQPLLQQWSGSYAGILLTAAAFSCLHGWNYEWHWQYLLVLLLVGSAFGIARDRTGSTAASFMLHMGYNLTQLAGAVAAQQLS